MNNTNTNHPTAFALDSLTNRQLAELLENVQKEQTNRATRRARWISETYTLYLRHPRATCMRIDDTIVVSVYSRAKGLRMCHSAPRHGDQFNLTTGVAVAFAKACGETISDYI